MTLVERTADALDALVPTGARCLVAVSGGADSLALLDLLHRGIALHGHGLAVGHVDHGIHPESRDVADRVAREAAARGLEFRAIGLHLPANASETRARHARRVALRSMTREFSASVIVLAHHADDQAETVLLRLLKGSGPAGLAGMASRNGIWIRPLLTTAKSELRQYLAEQGITPWSDPANEDPRHLRSWLRMSVMPLLSERLPELRAHLVRAGLQAERARHAWDAIPAQLAELELRRDGHGISVAAPPLCGYRSEVRHAILAALGRRFGVPLGERRLDAVDRLLFGPSGGGVIHLSGELAAELAFGRLTFQKIEMFPSTPVALTPGAGASVGAMHFALRSAWAGAARREGWETELEPGRYFARPWQPGDRIRPLGGKGSRAVAVLLREARIPPRRRAVWPVVTDEAGATIVWVPGICRSDARIPEKGAEALHVECAVA